MEIVVCTIAETAEPRFRSGYLSSCLFPGNGSYLTDKCTLRDFVESYIFFIIQFNNGRKNNNNINVAATGGGDQNLKGDSRAEVAAGESGERTEGNSPQGGDTFRSKGR